jgi:regulator of protease activity HflC (stomatin/prohibitin superfamily)
MNAIFFLFALGLLVYGLYRALTPFTFDSTHRPQYRFRLEAFVPYLIAAVALFVLFSSFTTVDTGYRGVVLRFGAVTGRILDPGPHLILPVAESVARVNVQTQIVKPDEQAASHDLQIVHTQVTLGYYIDPSYVTYIYSQLNDDAKTRVITPAILESIKATTARYDAEQLIANRAAVRDGIEDFVKQRLTPHHVIVDSVSITDFNFSAEYNQAIESKVTAAQNALKAENDLRRIKIEADQKVAQATGEAEALKVQKEQITPELLQLRTIEMMNQRWDGHLPESYYGGTAPLPMMDVLKGAPSSRR